MGKGNGGEVGRTGQGQGEVTGVRIQKSKFFNKNYEKSTLRLHSSLVHLLQIKSKNISLCLNYILVEKKQKHMSKSM